MADEVEQLKRPPFSWNDSDSIVIERVRAIAVYPNADGNIVVRQQADGYGEEDAIVIVPADRVQELIAAIKDTSEEITF